MLPDDQSAGWPAEGEIDIMEHVGYDPGRVHGTVHTAAFNHMAGTQVGASTIVSDYNTTFHTYAIEWTPNEIRWFIDDMQYHSFTNQGGDDKWPFNKDFHFILNVAVGGACSESDLNQSRSITGACSAINTITQSINTRSLALTCRLGGKARYIGIGAMLQSSNSGSNSPVARCGLAM
jgi:hypothetical protein